MKNKNLRNYVCSKCGSNDIRRDADCRWNAHKQEWEIANYADKEGFCLKCQKSQKIKEVIYEELEKGDGLHCEICGIKVEDISCLTDYDGLLVVDDGYQCCNSCTEKLEQTIKDTISTIRDVSLRNKTTIDATCPKCNHKYSYQIASGYKGRVKECPKCKHQDPRR